MRDLFFPTARGSCHKQPHHPHIHTDPSRLALSSDAGRRLLGLRIRIGRAQALPLPDDSTSPGNEQEEGRSTTSSGPSYAYTTTTAAPKLLVGRRWAFSRGPGVFVIASIGKGQSTRPRATDQQLVGVGQGGYVLPNGRKGVRGGVCARGRGVERGGETEVARRAGPSEGWGVRARAERARQACSSCS